MTGPRIKIDAAGALTRLRAALAKADDLSPVLGGAINKSVDTLFQRQFDSEGAYGGTKWAALTPATKKLRTRRGHGRGGIGRDTNRMWASFTKLGLGPEAVKVLTKRSLERGSQVPYARIFDGGYMSKTFAVLGTDGSLIPLRRKKPKKVPARPIVPDPVPAEIVRTWEKLIADFVGEA